MKAEFEIETEEGTRHVVLRGWRAWLVTALVLVPVLIVLSVVLPLVLTAVAVVLLIVVPIAVLTVLFAVLAVPGWSRIAIRHRRIRKRKKAEP